MCWICGWAWMAAMMSGKSARRVGSPPVSRTLRVPLWAKAAAMVWISGRVSSSGLALPW